MSEFKDAIAQAVAEITRQNEQFSRAVAEANRPSEQLRRAVAEINRPGEQLRRAVAELSRPNEQLRRATAEFARHERQRWAAAADEAKVLLEEIPDAPADAADEYLREHPPSALAIVILIKMAADMERSQSASNAAKLKNDKARKWICAEWEREGGEYKDRTDFVKIKIKIMRQKFPKAKVTAQTVWRDWLKPRA